MLKVFFLLFSCDTQKFLELDAPKRGPSKMEDLQDINFLATIEGQDYEESLRKIISNNSSNTPKHFRVRSL